MAADIKHMLTAADADMQAEMQSLTSRVGRVEYPVSANSLAAQEHTSTPAVHSKIIRDPHISVEDLDRLTGTTQKCTSAPTLNEMDFSLIALTLDWTQLPLGIQPQFTCLLLSLTLNLHIDLATCALNKGSLMLAVCCTGLEFPRALHQDTSLDFAHSAVWHFHALVACCLRSAQDMHALLARPFGCSVEFAVSLIECSP